MKDWIVDLLYDRPERVKDLGSVLAYGGFIALMAGLFGLLFKAVRGVLTEGTIMLADIFNPWMTFWIPEQIYGAIFCLILSLVGCYFIVVGKEAERKLKRLGLR